MEGNQGDSDMVKEGIAFMTQVSDLPLNSIK